MIVHDREGKKVRILARAHQRQPGFWMNTGEKKSYPLRISPQVLDAMQRWANDELRSLNAQIEYVLRDALRKVGRMKADTTRPAKSP